MTDRRSNQLEDGRRWRAWALFALLLASSVSIVLPTAAAQSPELVILFPGQDGADPTARAPGNMVQGGTLTVRLNPPSGATPWIRARCVTECHDQGGANYYVRWQGQDVVFPNNFNQPGPNNDGRNALSDNVPRYNGTWELTALLNPTPQTRQFNVWLIDFYKSPNMTVEPGGNYLLHGRGYDASNITLRIDHKGADGAFRTIAGPIGLSTPTPSLIYRWEVPKSEAARIRECRQVALDCSTYRLTLAGGGKHTETLYFRMEPSVLRPTAIEPTGALARTVARTENLSAEYLFHYPGGSLFQGQPVTPDDLPASSITPYGTMRVRVENVTTDAEGFVVAEALMAFKPGLRSWRVDWTVPKDLPLPASGQANYRLVIPETRDAWGNRIPKTVLGNFTVTSATLDPVLVSAFTTLPRTEEGSVKLAFRYLNGSLWEPTDNATPIEACYRKTSASTAFCADSERVIGKFVGNGTWAFNVTYPRTHPDLEAYRFVLLAGEQDKYGNQLRGIIGPDFLVVAGSPRIEFKTVLDGLDTTRLERGHRVAISATVTYGDGAPYNSTVAFNHSRLLNFTLIKRSASGEIIDERAYSMTQTNAEAGRYFLSMDLALDERASPLGDWTFRFDVLDNATPANRNVTVFHREVVAAPIQLQPVSQPSASLATGSIAKFRFRLFYEDGREVPETDLTQRLEARVYPHDGTQPFGRPLSPKLIPTYELGSWNIQYTIPNQLYLGRYAIVVTGQDRAGNLLEQASAISRPWTTYAVPYERGALTEPPREVARGESAAVVFDGDPGDTGPDARGAPIIRVERFDTTRDAWVVEALDARQPGFEGFDHYGVFQVFETTTIGTYRFVMSGRDAEFRPFNATTKNFTVASTEVQRAIVVAPPREVVKGDLVSFSVERRDGDSFRDVRVLFNGRTINVQKPVVSSGPGFTNITWAIPFDAPTGNYSVIASGRDVYGNTMEVRSPFISALPTQLQGQTLGVPARLVERGQEVSVLFGITYPNGQFYASGAAPTATIQNASGQVAQASVVRQGLTYLVSWTPPVNTEADDYWFEISGSGAAGNLFPTLRTQAFHIASGSFARDIAGQVGATYSRGDTAHFAVAYAEGDKSIEFSIEYYGGVTQARDIYERKPLRVLPLPHVAEPENGQYVVKYATDLSTSVGAYRFVMTGEDAKGNVLNAQSEPFLVRTVPIIVRWDRFPPQNQFGEGVELLLKFRLEYANGDTMTEADGRPNVAVLYNSQPTSTKPELTFVNGVWHLKWQVPDTLIDGRYSLTVGGADNNGNAIQQSQSTPYPYTSTVKESFGKVVPGPEPVLLALALVGAAAWQGRRMRRG